jgi:hypothetical protein
MSSGTWSKRALLASAAALLLIGAILNFRAMHGGGVDFPSLYVMGRGVLTGQNVYAPAVAATFPERFGVDVPMGMFYPPATGFTMLPFAALPYQAGKLLWFLTMEVVLVLGIRRLVKVVVPRAGEHVWLACAAIISVSAALRWAMILLQGAPLLVGLLCWFVAAQEEGRPRLSAALAILAVALKMTLSLPFLGLLLLRRRYFAVAGAAGTWLLLNVVGFWRMGAASLPDYRASVAGLEAFGNINSPDPWNVRTSPRLDWTSLFYGAFGNISLARLATLAATGLVALWLLREGLRVRAPYSVRSTALFLPPLVCLGSLCVYHHHYDVSLFFVPVLLWGLVLGRESSPRWGVFMAAPLLGIMLLLPFGFAQNMASKLFGEHGIGLLKLSFPVALTAALIGSLAMLFRGLREAEPELAPAVRRGAELGES